MTCIVGYIDKNYIYMGADETAESQCIGVERPFKIIKMKRV